MTSAIWVEKERGQHNDEFFVYEQSSDRRRPTCIAGPYATTEVAWRVAEQRAHKSKNAVRTVLPDWARPEDEVRQRAAWVVS